jgi:hydrogenase maturation protein HypF
MDAPVAQLVQQHLRVRGAVQGVGFRPFVYRLATELGLDGWVRNDAAGVSIALRGTPLALARFAQRLRAEAPPLARIDAVEESEIEIPIGSGFCIETSGAGPVATGITPDAAICAACVSELFDPQDRRYRYPFINCTRCGPRFTITARLPYDRPQTSMAAFRMCAACQREYDAPTDRRFHAQPNACAACGPRLALLDDSGAPLEAQDAIAAAAARLRNGAIVALKGLGGFQLVCDARNAAAVAELRRRKHRDAKPFAVMVANTQSLASCAQVEPAAAALLNSAARPIVLLPKRSDCDRQLPGVAPGVAELGAMLPTTPLHWLLFHEFAGQPADPRWLHTAQDSVLVMTSANPGDEPLVINNNEAVARLGGIADVLVVHDRDILVRCDDSVVRAGTGAKPRFIRRARGYTPAPIRLPRAGAPVLALGGHLKNTACLTRGDEAFLSPHIGDLDNAPSRIALEEAVDHLRRVLEIRPQAVAHDLHPDYYSTQLAQRLAAEWQVPALGVQHHHAHIAAVAAEHGCDEPVLGLALDGVGYGTDGSAWGGELLLVEGAQFRRLSHIRTLPLPGGDRAAREPWRMAAAVLHALGRADEIAPRFAQQPAARTLADLFEHPTHCPRTSSAGRWFDAAAALLGVNQNSRFEGQAAMQLEALAWRRGPTDADAQLIRIDDGTLNLLPLLERLAGECDPSFGAALFHATLAQALAQWVAHAAREYDIRTVACGGGCFLNRLLAQQLDAALSARGLRLLQAEQAPPNDGGIALGQAWAAQQLVD